jgi:hypothetical protein
MWSGFYQGRRAMRRYGVSVGGIFLWRKFVLALLASMLALALMHGTLTWLSHSVMGVLLSLGLFAAVYCVSARFILREEFDYVVRAVLRRRAAT